MHQSYFNPQDVGNVSSAVAAEISPVSIKAINAAAIKHHEDYFLELDLRGAFKGDIFTCHIPGVKDPDSDFLEVNIDTGCWTEHGEYNATGSGMISLTSHLDGYSEMEAAKVVKEWLGKYHPAELPPSPPIKHNINLI